MQGNRRYESNRAATYLCAAGGLAMLALAPNTAAAATLNTLHSFCTDDLCADGLNPINGLLRDSQGNLYGETTERGAFGHGTVFQLHRPPGKTRYKVRVLRDFCFDSGSDGCTGGESPGLGGHLIVDTQGAVYGTAAGGGAFDGGIVFKLTPRNGGKRWSFRELYDFCSAAGCADGNAPASLTYAGAAAGAAYDGASPLYGLAQFGGTNGKGVAFRLTPKARGQWSERVLYDFCNEPACADGANPAFDLLLDTNGNLFGVTADEGGGSNSGIVFKLSPARGPAWTETVLHTFCSSANCADGSGPSGGLVMDTAGNLFGVTAFGGNSGCRGNLGCGVIYKITPDGGQSVVHAFCSENNCTDGELPLGRLSIDAGGDLFGTTIVGGAHQGGTVFRLNGKGYQVVYDLCSGACGDTANEPLDGVILDEGGNLFGTAGGGRTNSGTVYQLTP